MELDRFLLVNGLTWQRLDHLNRRARGSTAALSASELDELVVLYQRVSTHLSYARTRYADPGLTARLSALVLTSGTIVYGTRPRSVRGFVRFFTHTFPAALWHVRPFVAASALLTFGPAAVIGFYFSLRPAALDAVRSQAEQAAYVKAETGYYSAQPSAQFASQVFTNNVRVAIVAFVFGIGLCIPTALVLIRNGMAVGEILAVFDNAGRQAELWGLLLPHGLIELSAVVVAGGAGLRLGWTLIDPGDRPRARALTEEGRRAVALVFGTAAMLLVAGSIEGFVTGSSLPTLVRVGIGVTVEVAFVTYAWVFGRRAHRQGLTGAIGEGDVGWARAA